MPLYDFNQLIQTAQESKPKFTVLEAGDYTFRVEEVPEVNNEKHYLKVKAKVAVGPRANYTHFQYISFKPDIKPFAAKQTLDFLTACGFTPDQLANAGSWDNIANALQGKTFTATATVEPNTYNGETRDQNRLQDFRPSSGGSLGGPNLGAGPGVPQSTPNVPQAAPAAPQATNQPNPWDSPAPPQQGGQPGPGTQFQAPPMPFGN